MLYRKAVEIVASPKGHGEEVLIAAARIVLTNDASDIELRSAAHAIVAEIREAMWDADLRGLVLSDELVKRPH